MLGAFTSDSHAGGRRQHNSAALEHTAKNRGSFISHRLPGAKERLFWLWGWGTAAAVAAPGALKGQTSIWSLSSG